MPSHPYFFLSALILLFAHSTCLYAIADDNQALDRFENEIKTYEAVEQAHPSPHGRTVFIGSSTFTRWKTLQKDLRRLQPINRGFGGSTIAEIVHYENRLIAHLHPSRIVFYAGTNDIAAGHNGQEVLADFKSFVQAAHRDAPHADIYFISMSVAPSRLSLEKEFDCGNQLISEYVKTDPELHFIDVRPVMRDKNNQLKASYFGPDNLHMTRAGYKAWIPIIVSALSEKTAQVGQ
jgi:lysophospholipase L1-like esterase